MTWVWDSKEQAWDIQFAEFKKYLAIFKSSKNISTNCDPKTRKWVYRQREHYRKGILSERRIKRLETIEDWEW